MLIFAFTGDGKCCVDTLRPGETLDSVRYVQFVRTVGDKWRMLRSSPTRLNELWWQHDNARPHVSAAANSFFQQRKIEMIRQSPYSPDLNFCDRWVFKSLKKHCRQLTFSNSDEIQHESLQWFRGLPQDRFLKEINSLYKHCKCVISCSGDYVV